MATKELEGLELKEVSDVIISSTHTRLHVIRWYVRSPSGSYTLTLDNYIVVKSFYLYIYRVLIFFFMMYFIRKKN